MDPKTQVLKANLGHGPRTVEREELLQFRIFGLGLLEDWDVGVGVFP
jgi:hypothetical protein